MNLLNKKSLITLVIILILIISGFIVMTKMKKQESTQVLIKTTEGNITIELYSDKAPITVENFLRYVDAKSYDGVIFHRVIKDFMIQTGGFKEDGSQITTFSQIKLESNNGLKNERGTLAMARTPLPNSATSQFFINVGNNDFLNYGVRDEGYAVFAKVIIGMEVIDKIQAMQTTTKFGMSDWPVTDVKIISVERV